MILLYKEEKSTNYNTIRYFVHINVKKTVDLDFINSRLFKCYSYNFTFKSNFFFLSLHETFEKTYQISYYNNYNRDRKWREIDKYEIDKWLNDDKYFMDSDICDVTDKDFCNFFVKTDMSDLLKREDLKYKIFFGFYKRPFSNEKIGFRSRHA